MATSLKIMNHLIIITSLVFAGIFAAVNLMVLAAGCFALAGCALAVLVMS